MSLAVRFIKNPTNDTTMYSEYILQLKTNSFEEKFCMAAFVTRNIAS